MIEMVPRVLKLSVFRLLGLHYFCRKPYDV